MKYSIVIIFITIQLINGIRSNEPTKVHPCDLVRCASVENCPTGTFLQIGNRDKGECCNSCKPYAKLGEKCGIKTGTTLCMPYLFCFYENDFYNSTVCFYAWENDNLPSSKCDPTDCPTYKTCPKNTFLVTHNTTKRTCCEQCVPYSVYGDYCDSKQPCFEQLKCKNNICLESDACAKQQCQVITRCPNNTYFLRGNGLTRCCNVCLKYAELDEACDETTICGSNLICDTDSQTCKKSKLNCALIQCSQPKCDFGYEIIYDLNTSCCPYCDKAKN